MNISFKIEIILVECFLIVVRKFIQEYYMRFIFIITTFTFYYNILVFGKIEVSTYISNICFSRFNLIVGVFHLMWFVGPFCYFRVWVPTRIWLFTNDKIICELWGSQCPSQLYVHTGRICVYIYIHTYMHSVSHHSNVSSLSML